MRTLFTILFSTFLISIGFGQQIDIESERIYNVSEVIVNSFDGCCTKKGYKGKYQFNDIGQCIKSEHFFKRKHLSTKIYLYNEFDRLTHEIETYSINDKNRVDTNLIRYKLNNDGLILYKSNILTPKDSIITFYYDYNEFDKPKKIVRQLNPKYEWTQILTYDSLGRIVLLERLENDTLKTSEIRKYNKFDDLIYSLLPELVGKEKGDYAIFIGGKRIDAEEYYEYEYDELNRWTKKYIIIKNKKNLLETREYK
jgi:hypothetical protein